MLKELLSPITLEDGKAKDSYFLDGEGIKKIKKYFIREEVSL